MDISSLFQKDQTGEWVLSILFILYLVMGFSLPSGVASVIQSIFGKILLFLIVAYLFTATNAVVATLGLLVAFDMMRKAYISTGNYGLDNFLPSEMTKSSQMSLYNQFPYTLEQEVVAKMAPIPNGAALGKAPYKPYMENLYDASKVTKGN